MQVIERAHYWLEVEGAYYFTWAWLLLFLYITCAPLIPLEWLSGYCNPEEHHEMARATRDEW